MPTGRAVPPATRIREVRAAVIASFSPHIGASFTFVHLNRELLISSHFLARHQAVKLTQVWRVDYPSVRRKETRYSCTSKLLYTIDVLTGLFLPILGKSHFFFSWKFFHRLSKVVSYWVKNYRRKTKMLSFLTVIDTTFHLIINILFSGAMISALQLYDWEKSFWIGKNPLIWHWEWGLTSAPWEP